MLAKFQSVRHPSSPQAVTDQILALLRSGDLVSGDQLPPEREIALALGVSRPSVREAIRSLAESGVVTVKHGRGTFVSAGPPLAALRRPLDTMLLLRQISVANLVEARSIVEGEAVALAAKRMADGDKARLREILARMKGVDDAATFLELDHEFHLVIAGGTSNPVLRLMLDAVRGVLLDAWLRSAGDLGALRETYREHVRIVEAVERGDAAGAREAMLEHLGRTKRRIDAQIARDGAKPTDGDPGEVTARHERLQ